MGGAATLAMLGIVHVFGKTTAERYQKIHMREKVAARRITIDTASCRSLQTEQQAPRKERMSSKTASPSSKRRAVAEDPSADETMSKIAELELQISESRKYYNNIVTLLSMLEVDDNNARRPKLAVAVSLCRVFSRLIASGNMVETNRADENERIIVAWLKERGQEYQKALIAIMREGDASAQVCIWSRTPLHLGSMANGGRLRL